jgi:hypothetical protein
MSRFHFLSVAPGHQAPRWIKFFQAERMLRRPGQLPALLSSVHATSSRRHLSLPVILGCELVRPQTLVGLSEFQPHTGATLSACVVLEEKDDSCALKGFLHFVTAIGSPAERPISAFEAFDRGLRDPRGAREIRLRPPQKSAGSLDLSDGYFLIRHGATTFPDTFGIKKTDRRQVAVIPAIPVKRIEPFDEEIDDD